MPWPWGSRVAMASAEQQSFGAGEQAMPPDQADGCFVSVVGGSPASISFGGRALAFEQGLILQPGQQPFFIPFAEPMWFTTEGGSEARVSVLWIRQRLLERPPPPAASS